MIIDGLSIENIKKENVTSQIISPSFITKRY